MYFIYLTNILRLYFLVRSIHGVYVSYNFIKWVTSNMYFSWLQIYFHNNNFKEIKNREIETIFLNDYVLINYID